MVVAGLEMQLGPNELSTLLFKLHIRIHTHVRYGVCVCVCVCVRARIFAHCFSKIPSVDFFHVIRELIWRSL
jgi:hypothetical protein